MSNEAALNIYQDEIDDSFARDELFTQALESCVSDVLHLYPLDMPRDASFKKALANVDDDLIESTFADWTAGDITDAQLHAQLVRHIQRERVIHDMFNVDNYQFDNEEDMKELGDHLPESVA